MERVRTPWGDYQTEHHIPLRFGVAPRARRRFGEDLRQLTDATIVPLPESTVDGPLVVLLDVEDIGGPLAPQLLEQCRAALPGRPVICGGSRSRDTLLSAINSWHAFRLLRSRTTRETLSMALQQAHEALCVEVRLERTAVDLGRQCRRLQRTLDQLQAAQQQLVRVERLAIVQRLTGVLLERLRDQAGNLDALERSLASLQDPVLTRLLGNTISRARSMSRLLEEMLEISRQRSQERITEEDLDQLVERVSSALRHEPEMRRRTLHVACSSRARVHVSRPDISLALMNLLRDAVDSTDNYAMIQVRTFTNHGGQRAVIEVNNGGGEISAASARSARAGESVGDDSSLWLTRLSVECQGGALHRIDTPGSGTCYRVLLPLEKPG